MAQCNRKVQWLGALLTLGSKIFSAMSAGVDVETGADLSCGINKRVDEKSLCVTCVYKPGLLCDICE